MNEAEPGVPAATPAIAPGTTTPGASSATTRVGDRLRAAREASGLSLAEVGQRTRVPLRHLEAIETTDFAALPSPTYAIGFSRAYARAVGLDDVAVAGDVRTELAGIDRPPGYEPYETADPARVPSRGVAIVGLGLAVAIMVLVGLWYGTDLFRGGAGNGAGSGGATTAAIPAAPRVASAPVPAAPRQVTLTAGANEVWMRVYDADNTTLYLGTLQPGEKFDVPPAANGPKINVGRPDQLQVTLDGRPIPPLGTGERAIKDVPVDAAAIAARLAGTTAPASTPAAAIAVPAAPERTAPRPRPTAAPAPTRPADAAINPAAAAPPPATNTTATE